MISKRNDEPRALVPTFADVMNGYSLEHAWRHRHRRYPPTHALQIETLVSTTIRDQDRMLLPTEYRRVAELCTQARSVAEVAALLKVPLGLSRVWVADMAGQGLVLVHQTWNGEGNDMAFVLMDRVLNGLRRL